MKDRVSNQVRAEVVESTDAPTLQGFLLKHTVFGVLTYTDKFASYQGLPEHDTVKHSSGEYVKHVLDDAIHINGMESFWSALKRAHKGTFHKISPKHLNRYVQEFAGKHNVREQDTLEQKGGTVTGMAGKRLHCANLIADSSLGGMAR